MPDLGFTRRFERHVVPKSEQELLVSQLSHLLPPTGPKPQLKSGFGGPVTSAETLFRTLDKGSEFWHSLEPIDGDSIKRYMFASPSLGTKVPVALKDTYGSFDHGADIGAVRHLFAIHHYALLNPEKAGLDAPLDHSRYELHLPRNYSNAPIHGWCLPMEEIEGVRVDKLLTHVSDNKPVYDSLRAAFKQYEANIQEMLIHGVLSVDQDIENQTHQVMVAGHRDPRFLGGKPWVFFAPYDID